MKLSEQLRDAIRQSGLSLRAIARATGTDVSVLSRFMAGEGGLPIGSIDAVARLLRVRLLSGRVDERWLRSVTQHNWDTYRIRCIDDRFDSIVSDFPRVGFKAWEAEERERLRQQCGRAVRLTHYRLDSPEGHRRLPARLRKKFKIIDATKEGSMTAFVIHLKNASGQNGWVSMISADAAGKPCVLTSTEIALANKYPDEETARRALDRFARGFGVNPDDARIDEIAVDRSFRVELGTGEWPDAIEVAEHAGKRYLLIRDASEEVTQDVDDNVGDVLIRVLAKIKTVLRRQQTT